LEKIKRERAEEKARQEKEKDAQDSAARDAKIAVANPLLQDLAARMSGLNGVNTTAPGTFSVKRRWDDGGYLALMFHTQKLINFHRSNIQGPSNEFSWQGSRWKIHQRSPADGIPQVCSRSCLRIFELIP
jgi:hypothetical protein